MRLLCRGFEESALALLRPLATGLATPAALTERVRRESDFEPIGDPDPPDTEVATADLWLAF